MASNERPTPRSNKSLGAKMRHFLLPRLVLGILVVIWIQGCSKDDASPTSGTNHAPVIISVTASPDTVSSGYDESQSTVSCVVTDADGDNISYRWSCPSANFSYKEGYSGSRFVGTEPSVRMDSFDLGDNWVRVTVSDGREIDVDSVKVVGQ